MSAGRSIKPIPHSEFQIGARGAAAVVASLDSQLNGMFEIATGTPVPGENRLLMKPHDHCRSGVPLARNAQYSFDCGDDITKWQWTTSSANEWWKHDGDGSAVKAEDSSGNRYLDTPPNFLVDVTEGIDTDKTAISTNPCKLRILGLISVTSGVSLDLRVYNRTTRTASGASNFLNGANQKIDIQVDLRGGVVNELDLETKSGGAVTIAILQLLPVETRTQSQPQSAGSQTYSTATKP